MDHVVCCSTCPHFDRKRRCNALDSGGEMHNWEEDCGEFLGLMELSVRCWNSFFACKINRHSAFDGCAGAATPELGFSGVSVRRKEDCGEFFLELTNLPRLRHLCCCVPTLLERKVRRLRWVHQHGHTTTTTSTGAEVHRSGFVEW